MKKSPRANLLMIEGTTDALVANHLADWHGVPDYYDYKHYEGIEPLLVALPRRVRESERKRVAVVVDADSDPAARWMSVRDRLIPFGYAVPQSPAPDGTVLEAPNAELSRVGIWMMPDNVSPGILEHFVQQLVLPGDALLPLARDAVASIPDALRRFPGPRVPKAEIYTWLAWQEMPGCSFGPAIKAGMLDGGQPSARRFTAWVRRVFD